MKSRVLLILASLYGPAKAVMGTLPTLFLMRAHPCFGGCSVSSLQQIFVQIQATCSTSSLRSSNYPAPVATPQIEHNVVRPQLDTVEHAATKRSR